MIIHHMRLLEEPFEMIKAGRKIVEVRLNDEKRKMVAIGDAILFSKLPENKEAVKVKVLGLLQYKSFETLYTDLPHGLLGWEGKTVKEMLEATYRIYTREQEEKLGVLGIRIELFGV